MALNVFLHKMKTFLIKKTLSEFKNLKGLREVENIFLAILVKSIFQVFCDHFGWATFNVVTL